MEKLDKSDNSRKRNASAALNVISKLVQDIEKKVLEGKTKAKECEELKLLKEKCCDKNAVVSLSAFHGIVSLVERRILVGSQTISMLISLLPSISQYAALVSTVGKILLFELHNQVSQTGAYACPYSTQIQHPLIIMLKFCPEKSWFPVYSFVLQLIQMNEDIAPKHKVKFLRPVVREVFWESAWGGSELQMKLFGALLLQAHHKEYLCFALEALLWQPLDIHHCMLLQELFSHLLSHRQLDSRAALCGLAPALAQATRWLIVSGHNPSAWLRTLSAALEADSASGSAVLFILSEVVMETPSVYINLVMDVCKAIVVGGWCGEYVAYKMVAEVLEWFMNPSFLANPLYQRLEEMVELVTGGTRKWSDGTAALSENEYYRAFGASRAEVRLAVDLILVSRGWGEGKASVGEWVRSLCESNERRMQLKLHSFIEGIVLRERDNDVVNLCLELLFKLIDPHREVSFSLLCLLFYKLGREADPTMQKIFLFSLPKLAVQKENLPLIVGIIESLKRGRPRVMRPLVIQLYLSLWKFDRRTYSYLHGTLHDSTPADFAWELSVSRAMALREICRLAPHLHAKDLVAVLSSILNHCAGSVSGLPSAIAIDAVTELCKAYVIDVAGTWTAIQPKLRLDKRRRVIKSLCRFFGEIPSLHSSEQKHEGLIRDIVPMLWDYTFSKDRSVVRSALRALSNFPLENLPLALLPELYRQDIRLPKGLDSCAKTPDDILSLPYVPADCWIRFLSAVDEDLLHDAGDLLITLIDRELSSLPRGLFFLPPEKPEPPSYSYLPPRSIARALLDHLRTHAPRPTLPPPPPHQHILRVLAHTYSKPLPPLDWSFLNNLIPSHPSLLRHALTLLANQAHVSTSAKSSLENYFNSADWPSQDIEHILFVYTLLPLLCKNLSYNALQSFLDLTIQLTLRPTLHHNAPHFQRLLLTLTDTLTNKTVHIGHKTLIARHLQKVLPSIPPDHQAIKAYAHCATDFPMKSLEQITSIKHLSDVTSDWLRRAAAIRCAIALRPDINEPLSWLNELTEAAGHFPEHHHFILTTICSVATARRDCDHRGWLQDLTWRIQALTSASGGGGSPKVTLFLLDVFVTAAILLSGHDCLFAANDLSANRQKKLHTFPHALSALLSSPDWTHMLPKVAPWLEKLLAWRPLPQDHATAFLQAAFSLRDIPPNTDTPCLLALHPPPLPPEDTS